MNTDQFKRLKKGMKVEVLTYSVGSKQTVECINLKDMTISTVADNGAHYTYPYQDVKYLPNVKPEHQKAKVEILKKFTEFIKNGCDDCPFSLECDNTYEETRAHSTNPLTICEALNKQEVEYM